MKTNKHGVHFCEFGPQEGTKTITEIIEIIEKHIKVYEEAFPNQKDAHEIAYYSGVIDVLTDLRNEFARELKNEN